MLLVAVGAEATEIFPSLGALLRAAPDDAVPLRLPGGALEELPPRDATAAWHLPSDSGFATLAQLADDEAARALGDADHALRMHWAELRAELLPQLTDTWQHRAPKRARRV